MPRNLSKDELLARLEELCEEVGARVGDYLLSDSYDELLEGLMFAKRAADIADCNVDDGRILRGIFWTKRRLEEKAARARAELVAPAGPSLSADWQHFLADHPELGAAEEREPTPPRLEFTDEDVLDALGRACASRRERGARDPGACEVLRELGGDYRNHGDLMRVVAGLRRLERAGRVVQEKRYLYGQRCPSDWRPADQERRAA